MNISAVAILIGYLIGSISPSYILGRLLRGIDIRDYGDGNAGGMNTYYVLGLKPAIITVVFDLSKGLVSMYFASILGASLICIQLAGLAAILGHVFPLYLKFRGGKGIGTAVGILFYYLYLMIKNDWLSPLWLFIYVASVILIFYISRRKEILGAIALPLLLVIILFSSPLNLVTAFAGLLILYMFFINFLINIYKKQTVEQEKSHSLSNN